MRVGQVTAVAWPAQAALAVALAEAANQPAVWPGLGRRSAGPLRLIVVPDGHLLDSLSGGRAPAWGAAIALPGARTILIRGDTPDAFEILRHELAHLVLHDAVRVRVPLWFDEGYASWAAGEWDRLEELQLNLAVARGSVPELRELDAALRGGRAQARVAYALAVTAVLELARRNPTGTLDPLLARLGAGEDFEAAVLRTTGLSPDRFEEDWRRAVRRRYGLFTWLAAGGFWAVVALAVLGVWWRRRQLDRPRRAALDIGWTVSEPEDADTLDPDAPPK